MIHDLRLALQEAMSACLPEQIWILLSYPYSDNTSCGGWHPALSGIFANKQEAVDVAGTAVRESLEKGKVVYSWEKAGKAVFTAWQENCLPSYSVDGATPPVQVRAWYSQEAHCVVQRCSRKEAVDFILNINLKIMHNEDVYD